jgi:predicted transcriptional regulator
LEAKSIILHFVNASHLTLNRNKSIIQFRWHRQLLTIKQKEDSSNNFKITDKSIKKL